MPLSLERSSRTRYHLESADDLRSARLVSVAQRHVRRSAALRAVHPSGRDVATGSRLPFAERAS